jgi:hypothetical protein
MPGTRNEAHDVQLAPRHAAADALNERDESQDPTTLKFNGTVQVVDEDAGGDPYNRTGRFKRFVR